MRALFVLKFVNNVFGLIQLLAVLENRVAHPLA
jgi:hypothetical protein